MKPTYLDAGKLAWYDSIFLRKEKRCQANHNA